MTVTKTIEVPADHRITFDVPREVPTGANITIQFPVAEEKPAFEPHPCPICREKFQDPVTGEMRYGPKTMEGMKEVEDMLAGKIPNTLKSFNSAEEMFAYLKSDDGDDE